MRIGISTSVIQRGKSGVAQYVFALLRGLLPSAAEHQFTLFVLEQDFPLFEFAKDRMQLVPVPEKFRSPVRNIWWHQTRLPRLARQQQLDVLHVPSYRRMLWRRPCPLVATIHDLAPFRLSGKYDRARMFYGRVVARRLAWRQNEIIAVSENTAHDLVTCFGLPREKITVIYNGVDHERFFPGSREEAQAIIAKRYGLTQPFFLYTARLEHPAKNHLRLIEAFEQYKAATRSPWQLVFAGSDWHGAETIHEAIQRSPCAADIRALGFVPDADLPNLYRAADVFVYPSLYEGFGMPPLEAMACGCPVMASARGSLGEVLDEAAALVEPEELSCIERQLYSLATDSAVRNRFRAAGLAQAQKFNWRQTADKTLQVYQNAAKLLNR